MKSKLFLFTAGALALGILLIGVKYAMLACAPTPQAPRVIPRPLHVCRKWYIDVGTNIGVQIRKLYEPWKYPGAAALPILHDYLTVRDVHTDLCVLGIEMNPSHSARLAAIEHAYRERCHFDVTILRETAAQVFDGNVSFNSDLEFDKHEWGASTVKSWARAPSVSVRALDLQAYISKFILSTNPDTIVMKLDIEGAERTVLASLLASGTLCHFVDVLMVEYHPQFADVDFLRDHIAEMVNLGACKTKILTVDDESYLNDVDSQFECAQQPTH